MKKKFKGRIAKYLKMARSQAALSQPKLAATIGVSVRTVREWEQGCALPSAVDLQRLHMALPLTIGELVLARHYDDLDRGGYTIEVRMELAQ